MPRTYVHPVLPPELHHTREMARKYDSIYLSPSGAYPLLLQATKATFGNGLPIIFDRKKLAGGKGYLCRVVLLWPDGHTTKYPASGRRADVVTAQMVAAYRAVLAGAIEDLIDAQGASKTPRLDPQPERKPVRIKIIEQTHPVTRINNKIQAMYRAVGTLVPPTAQVWDVKELAEGFAAKLSISLPSGKEKTYGSSDIYGTPKQAKSETAKLAVKQGALEFIQSMLAAVSLASA